MTYPSLPSHIGKRGRIKFVDGGFGYYTIEDEIVQTSSIGPGDKKLVLQRIEYDDGNTELRFGYYVIGKKGRMKGKWTWGQFSPFIPLDNFINMVDEAKRKGWFS